jgi:hypothetical protein
MINFGRMSDEEAQKWEAERAAREAAKCFFISLVGPGKTRVEYSFKGVFWVTRWDGLQWSDPVRKPAPPYLIK